MDYCLIIFDAVFKTATLRDRAARYLAKATRPEWGDDYPDDDEPLFDAVDDCVFPLQITRQGKTGLRWICSGGEYDNIPADWPERLQASSGTSMMCICADGENGWQICHYDGTATRVAYVSRFFDNRELDQPIEDFERQFSTQEWQNAMFACDERALSAMADDQAARWLKTLAENTLPATHR